MSVLREKRRGVTRIAISVAGACLVAYFAYYTIDGDRGLNAMTRLRGEVSVAETRLDVLQAQHATLENQVSKLRPGGIDPDLLDERARAVLNFSKPNDLIIRQNAR